MPGFKKKTYKKKDTALTDKQKKAVAKIAVKVTEKRVEHKLYIRSLLTQVVSDGAGSYFTELTSVPQGDTDSTRDGDELYLKHLDVMIRMSNGVGINSYGHIVWRVMLFQYKSQDNTPVISEMLSNSAANVGTVGGSFSHRNIDYLGVYNVLYDKTFTTHGSNGAIVMGGYDYADQEKVVKIRCPLKYAKKKIQFENGTSSASNAIWMLVTTDKDSVAVNPTITYSTSTGFTDS